MWILIAFIIYSETEFEYQIQGYDTFQECQEAREETKAHYPTPEIQVYSVCLQDGG